MCGVLGLIGREPVSERLVKGAGRLQNRGDRSTAAVTYDRSFFYRHGGLAPPLMVFADYDVNKLKGNCGIVHTRYATTGGNTPEMLRRNMQPVVADRPTMATCVNGDLINVVSQTHRLQEKGFSFQSEVDAKVIQATLTDALLDNRVHRARSVKQYAEGLFASLEQMHRELVGAYSALNVIEKGLLAFKDPHGIRPLCMALRRDASGTVIEVAFSSESSVFNYFGDYADIRELKPGEAVFVDHKLRTYRKTVLPRQEAFCFFEFVYFARPDSRFKGQCVETVRERLGEVLAKESAAMAPRIDVVLPLPGTAMSAAQRFAETLQLPIRHALIKTENKRSFQETSEEKRKKAIDDKFLFLRDFIKGQRVAVIDDSNVRGTTGKKIVRRLKELGAKQIHMFYFCPPITGSCYYGIDTPDQRKLIAFNKDNAQIRRAMKCTSVTYISHDGLIRGLRVPEDQLCTACITRNYPTPTDEIPDRVRQRRRQRRA